MVIGSNDPAKSAVCGIARVLARDPANRKAVRWRDQAVSPSSIKEGTADFAALSALCRNLRTNPGLLTKNVTRIKERRGVRHDKPPHRAATPRQMRARIYDWPVPGLAVRCTDTGAKSFVLVGRFPWLPQSDRSGLGQGGCGDIIRCTHACARVACATRGGG